MAPSVQVSRYAAPVLCIWKCGPVSSGRAFAVRYGRRRRRRRRSRILLINIEVE